MGIVKSNLHKRRSTGAKRTSFRHKRKFELGRPSSNTKLGQPKLKYLRVRGGNFKRRALRLNVGNFAWGSENCARKTRVLDVVYNASNNELVRTKTLVKGAIVMVDATPYRQFYEEYYNQSVANHKHSKVVPDEKVHEKRKAKLDARRKDHEEMETSFKAQFSSGKLLARISSRPGQVGRLDGYVLEGPEFAFYHKKILDKKKKK
eukprot:gene5739-9562_t